MLNKKPYTANLILFHIEYLPLLVLLISIFIALNLIILPIAYIKGIYVSIQQLFNTKIKSNLGIKISKLTTFVFLGIIILLLNLCSDLIVFIQHCYQDHMSYRKLLKNSLSLSDNSFTKLQYKFEKEHKIDVKHIEYQEMAIYMRSELKVFENIKCLVYDTELSEDQESSIQDPLDVVNEYVLIKKILCACSIPKDNDNYLYVEILRSIFRELRTNYKLDRIKNSKDKDQVNPTKVDHDISKKKDK